MEESKLSIRNLVFLLILLSLGIFSATFYALASIKDKVPMNWLIFFGWLGFLFTLNLILVLFMRRNWSLLGLGKKVGTILWGGMSMWYWSFAVFYFFLNMNVDLLQLKWTALIYFWEVSVVGSLFLLACFWVFIPIWRLLEKRDTSLDPTRIYSMTFTYPFKVAILIFAFSVFGYFLGTLQVRIFAFWPAVEQLKNILLEIHNKEKLFFPFVLFQYIHLVRELAEFPLASEQLMVCQPG